MEKCVLYVFFFCILSCTENSNKTEKDHINIPDNLIVYHSTDSLNRIELNSASSTIYTSVNVSCSTCMLEFDKWRAYGKSFKDKTISIFPICHSKDNFEMLKYLFESGVIKPLDFPLYLDKNNEFTELNKHLSDENHGLTVLVDSDNKILIKGSPIDDQALMKKYTKLINNQKQDDKK